MIKLIWAQTRGGIIGNHGQMPWNIPAEMRHFRKNTQGHDILMGRKTFESLNFKPLPKRFNYVLTRHNTYKNGTGYQYITDFATLIKNYQKSRTHDLYVIGGKEIIQLFFPVADEAIVSIINQEYPGTTKLDKLDWSAYQLCNTHSEAEFIVQYWQKK